MYRSIFLSLALLTLGLTASATPTTSTAVPPTARPTVTAPESGTIAEFAIYAAGLGYLVSRQLKNRRGTAPNAAA